MTVDTHEVVFSFDQPGDARNPLLSILQQLLNRPLARDSRAVSLLSARRVLIVDSQQERAQYIAHLLASARYWPFVAPTALDAYTLFLQGTFHPYAIVLSEENADHQFFFTRLAQQFLQRYEWNLPFIRLRISPLEHMESRSTGPLAHGQYMPRPTTPLSNPGGGALRPPPPAIQQPPSRPSLPRQTEANRSATPLPPGSQRAAGERLVRMRPSSQPPAPAQNSGQLPPVEPPPPSGPLSQVFNRPLAPLPPASQRSSQKQVEKISLDGLSIGRYQLKSIIGGNPIGDVYLTYDRLREQDIALKTIQTNMIPFHLMAGLEEDYNPFQQEMNLLQAMDHPHLMRVMNIGRSYISGFPFIYKTMPYYPEGSLMSWLRQFNGGIFPPADAARVIVQVASSIQFLHNRGLLYQNFKTTNILVANETTSMSNLQVIVTDLPFVRDVINLPKTVEAYRYFAPEQWESEAFTSSDQYGLAVLAYELLTGRTPFQGNSDTIMRRMHLTMPAPAPSSFNPALSPSLDKVLLRALAKRPEERFESISAFSSALERVANGGR